MNRHLVIGASGQMGGWLKRCVEKAEGVVLGTYLQHPIPGLVRLDIRDRESIGALIKEYKPGIVYLAAALSNVDQCELDRDLTYEINVLGTANVVQECNKTGAKLVFFSSDYIFDGVNGPYAECDLARPVCEYGRQKLVCEHYIGLHSQDHLVVRTTGVYSWEVQGKNFVHRLVGRLRRGERLRVPLDQMGNPTYSPNLAEAVFELATAGVKGVFHLVGPKRVSRYEFAVAAATAFALSPSLIEPVFTGELGQVAPRPLNAGLVAEKAQGFLQTTLVDFHCGLALMAAEESNYTIVPLSEG